MKTVKANGIDIAYRIDGSGDPLILIGGFTMVKESWGLQVADLAKRFRVITFDNRGVGGSTAPAEPFTIADMAADTIGLMDALDIPSAHFFGVSMGGLIAQVLALDYPDRVRKAALGCTTHGGKHAVQPEKEVMAILGKAADPGIPPEESLRMRLPIIMSEGFRQDHPRRVEAFVSDGLRHMPTAQGAKGQMGALSRFNVRDRLGEITCPVLVITGSEDRMMPPENADLLTDGISGAELVVIEGAGHSFFFEKPEEVNRVLIDFFLEA
ncbi:MAG: alpha/beta fold hydrolase [Deltaproteobacteria bacterium]|nr:alpha/beta fold hydrolase [Deltaproteobacteria bacterium]MBW1818967.1 alpha/beta fold hydrolase [Deltaproteobacteria bacterium]